MWLIWGSVYDLLSLDPCVWFPLDYHLCNNALLFEIIVICLGHPLLTVAHSWKDGNRKLKLLSRRTKKTKKTRENARIYMKTTWQLRTYTAAPHQLSHSVRHFPSPSTEIREHTVPDSTTLFCSLGAHFYWCQSTFPQCLSSLLPLDLLLVGVSALSFCFALR